MRLELEYLIRDDVLSEPYPKFLIVPFVRSDLLFILTFSATNKISTMVVINEIRIQSRYILESGLVNLWCLITASTSLN